MDVLRSYIAAGLPLNRNGLPPRKALNEHAGFRIEGWEKRECWPEAQAEPADTGLHDAAINEWFDRVQE